MTAATYARVIVEVAPPHLDHPFDYRIPEGTQVGVGQRVQVDFAGRRSTGWVVGIGEDSETDPARVRPLHRVQGAHAWFDEADLRLYRWVADRYAGSLAEVLRHALPARVAGVEQEAATWPAPGEWVPASRPPCPSSRWRPYGASRLLQAVTRRDPGDGGAAFWWRLLPDEDAVPMVADLVARCLASGRRALLLVPDPATPLRDAGMAAAGPDAEDFCAAAGQRERYRAFLRCRMGQARVVVGERSAALTPLPALGLVVLADEANPAYKERRAPRHHAREVALTRARLAGATAVVLGDVPSARLWYLVRERHVEALGPHRGVERERAPIIEVVDRSAPRAQSGRGRLADRTGRAVRDALKEQGAVAVVVPRRGEGTALVCRRCGDLRACPVCAGTVQPERASPAWRCRTCGWEGPPFACPSCDAEETAPLAAGAGRYARELRKSYPDADVAQMEGFDASGPRGRPAIGVMTRGSAVARPAWLEGSRADVVVVPEADAWLGRTTFDAAEDALRLWFAVARWAPRVVLQTRNPRHMAIQALVRWDPMGFWEREAERRAEFAFPPAAWLVRVSAPAAVAGAVADELRAALPDGAMVLGPTEEGDMLVKSRDLHGSLVGLRALRHRWSKEGRKVRVDVDPVEL